MEQNNWFEIEVWKDVIGFEGLYRISSYGRLFYWGREKGNGSGSYKRDCRLFDVKPLKSGYLIVTLSKDGFRVRYLMHRLVALHFVDNPENKPQVNHLDSDPGNNYFKNLEWSTQSENIQYAYDQKRKFAIKRPVFKMDRDGNILKEYDSASDAVIDGFSFKSISAVCLGKEPTHHGFKWKFKDAV